MDLKHVRNALLTGLMLLSCFSGLSAQEVAYPDYEELKDSMASRMLEFQKINKCKDINAVRQSLLDDLNPENKVAADKLPAKRKKTLDGKQVSRLCRTSSLLCCGMEYHPQTKQLQAYPLASAVALTAEGICVTNYHVLSNVILSGALCYQSPNDLMRFVMNEAGKVYPVEAILAADPINDFAIFKVNTGNDRLTPIPMDDPAEEGEDVYCLAHPRDIPFYLTKGIVSRNTSVVNKKNGHVRLEMQITADYGVGSSGGPIINSRGNLVGIVGSTYSMYADQEASRNFQMTIKKAVPVKLIRDCFISAQEIQRIPQEEAKVEIKEEYAKAEKASYGIRYLWTYLFDKTHKRTYQEDRVVLVSPSVTVDMSYQPIGEKIWREAHPKEALTQKDPSLMYHLTPSFYFYYPQQKRMKQTYQIISDEFLLKDTVCSPTWTVTDEERMVGEYTCKKAFCTNAGRKWIAWFTTELPYVAAPRNLNGLPGVVLEVSDEYQEIKWEYNGTVDCGKGKEQFIQYPNQFSPLPVDKFPLILRLFAHSSSRYAQEAGVIDERKAAKIFYPSTGVDACNKTNPMEYPL